MNSNEGVLDKEVKGVETLIVVVGGSVFSLSTEPGVDRCRLDSDVDQLRERLPVNLGP